MKIFAVNLLSELLGRAAFLALDPRDLEFFSKTLVYVIQREIDLASNQDKNFKSLVKDGLFGSGLSHSSKRQSAAQNEHLMRVQLNM